MEAGLILAIFTLSTKAAQAVCKAYDAYNSVERDEFLLKLDMEKHKFSEWVRSRRFTSKRALEHRIRTAADKTTIQDQYLLACRLILQVISTLQVIATILDKVTTSPKSGQRNKQSLKIPGVSASRSSSTLSVDTTLPGTAAGSVKSQYVASARKLTIAESVGQLVEEMKTEVQKLPQGFQGDIDSLDSLLTSSTSHPHSMNKISTSRKIKDVFRAVVLDSSSKLEQLIGKIHQWNEYLALLLTELSVDNISAFLKGAYSIAFIAPFPRNPHFIGRDDIMQKIEDHLDIEGNSKSVVLYGLGGYGKTQIALEYAYRSQNLYTSVIWIDATSDSSICTSAVKFIERIINQLKQDFSASNSSQNMILGQVANRLNLATDTNGAITMDLLMKEVEKNPVEVLATWLAQKGNNNWLLIADNFDSPEKTSGLLGSMIPNNDVGDLIVTTRAMEPENLGLKSNPTLIEVGGFGEDRAEDLLCIFANTGPEHLKSNPERKAATRIIAALKKSTLHITMTGAYITMIKPPLHGGGSHTHTNIFQAYWDEFEKQHRSALHYRDRKESYVLELSFGKLSPEAQMLLGVLVVYSHGAEIPEKLFVRWSEKAEEEEWFRKPDMKHVLTELSSYRFLTLARPERNSDSQRTYSMHEEIHGWLRDHLYANVDEHTKYSKRAYSLLASTFTLSSQARGSDEWRYEREILPHLEYIYESNEQCLCPNNCQCQGGTDRPVPTLTLANAEELYTFAKVFDSLSEYSKAEVVYRMVLRKVDIYSCELIALETMDSLGTVLRRRGNYEEAYHWTSKAFEGAQKSKGLDDPFTLQTNHNLAVIMSSKGDYQEALKRYKELLDPYLEAIEKEEAHCEVAVLEMMRGMADIHFHMTNYDSCLDILLKVQRKWEWMSPDRSHPLMLDVRGAIAATQAAKGSFKEALQEHISLVCDKKAIFGDKHYLVLTAIIEKGIAHLNLGELDLAMDSYNEAGKGFIKIFGNDDHPALLKAWAGIARVMERQGAYRTALELYTKVKEASARMRPGVRGEYNAINSVANMLFRMGRYQEALTQYQEARKGLAEVLGENHVRTLIVDFCIAGVYETLGNYEEALNLFERTLEAEERANPADPSKFVTVRCIASVLEKQGKYIESEEKFNIAIAGLSNAAGETHAETVAAHQGMARLQESQGKLKEALDTLDFVVKARKKVSGNDEHPMAYLAICSQARIMGKLGKYDDAMRKLETCIEAWNRQLDPDHPWILDAQHCMGSCLTAAGKYDAAFQTLWPTYHNRAQKLGKEHPDTSETKREIAAIKFHQQHYEIASQLLEETVDELAISLGQQHPSTVRATADRDCALKKLNKHKKVAQPRIKITRMRTP
ncbi:hypothetical protein BDZ91DRAFT_792060 [Kalaharituber pfeilii]|nr:hypothetical protein BDZ91DRAFT_792060 [Kalaharituber pfeilii]